MKKSLFGLCLAIVFAAPSFAESPKAVPPKTASKPADPLKGFRVEKDEMRGIAFYSHPGSPKYRNTKGVHLYFSKSADGSISPMHLVLQYADDSWLFVSSAWARADGVKLDLPSVSKFSGWERDHGNGGIWEWSDALLIKPADIELGRKLAYSKSATIRFEGKQYYSDMKLSNKQRSAMQATIVAYEAVTQKPWK